MRNQLQMLNYLGENIPSHEFKAQKNKIIAKRLIKTDSFASFKITFLKNGQLSLNIGRWTKRYNNEIDLYTTLNGVSYTKGYKPLTDKIEF
jgi:hypothetical protein